MNKLLTKIVGVVIGTSMAVGVGTAVVAKNSQGINSEVNAAETAATMTAGTNGSTCTVNGKDGIKVGTSSKGGDMTITVPSGAATLHLYAAAWKGVTGLSLNISGATTSPTSIALTADNGIANSSPFTLSGNEADFKFDLTLSGITSSTNIKFTSSAAKRFVVWAATYETGGTPTPQTYSVTYNNGGATSGDTPEDTNEYESGDEVTVLGKGNLTKTNCTFGGWIDQDDTTHAAGSKFNIAKDMTLTAVWTLNSAHAGTAEDPYTVADARMAIDAEVGVTGVYVTGIVSAIPYAYNAQNSNITFNIIDQGGSNFVQAYKCTGALASSIAIGDTVVVSGNLTKYNDTYEFAQGCTVESRTAGTVSSIAVKTAPTKVTYYAGDKFDPAGLVITATYSNSMTIDIAYAAGVSASFTFTPSTSTALTTSDVSVTIGYGNKTTTQAITVNADTVDHYTVTGTAKANYGGSWDLSDLVLHAWRNAGETIEKSLTKGVDYSLTTSTPVGAPGNKTVTVTDSLGLISGSWTANGVVSNTIDQTDRITLADIGDTGNSYSEVVVSKANGNENIVSSATYRIEGRTDTNAFLVRNKSSSNNYGGFVVTGSAGIVKSITLKLKASNSTSKTLRFYGKNTAYTDEAELFSNETKGTPETETITAAVSDNFSVETHVFENEYQYVGFTVSENSALIEYIDITWKVSAADLKPEISVGTTKALISTHQATAEYEMVTTYMNELENNVVYSASSANTNIATVSVSNSILTITPKAVGSTTVTIGVVDGEDREGTLELPVQVVSDYAYTQATSLSDIVVGAEYTFVGSNKVDAVWKYYASTSTLSGSSYITKAEVEGSAKAIVGAEGVESYTLVPASTSGKYALWSSAQNKYLSASGTSLSLVSTYSSSCDVTFAVSAGTIHVSFGENVLLFSSANNNGFTLSGSTMPNAGVYKNTTNEYSHFANALAWAETFNTQAGALCTPEDGSVVDGWDSMACISTYSSLANPVKDIIAHYTANQSGDAIAQAIARYDYATSTYSSLTKFIVDSGNTVRGANVINPVQKTVTDYNITMVVAIISIISLTTLGGYFLLRKRKEEK